MRTASIRQFRGLRWWWVGVVSGQLLFAVVIFFAFSGLFPRVGSRGGVLGYGLSVYAGIVVWSVFQDSFLQGLNLYDEFRGYVLRFRMPLTAYGLAASGLRAVTLFVGVVILVVGAWWLFGAIEAKVGLLVLFIPLLLAMAVGCSWLAGALSSLFPQLRHLAPQVLLLWFFSTPIVYPRAVLPASFSRIVALNPMTYVVETFQWLWLSSIDLGPLHWMVTIGWCGLMFGGGLLMTRICRKRILDTM